jgi:RNA polymerase sigma-70 factor (ECF subfamily)
VSGLSNKDFEVLALPLLDPLYNFARWLSGDADEARDLVQETFAKALKGFASFREVALIRRADTEMVQAAIAKLPATFREVLLLADFEEMRYQEVAEILSIPIGTVMSRLSRARKQVRQHIVESVGVKA